TAKLLTLFRPATGQVRATGVLSAPNTVLHPWLKEELTQILKPILKREVEMGRSAESERPVGARWRTWLWPHENDEGLPPLRILLVWDNLAGHLSHPTFRSFGARFSDYELLHLLLVLSLCQRHEETQKRNRTS